MGSQNVVYGLKCSMGRKLDKIQILFGKLIFIALLAYFILKIVESLQKFENEELNSHPYHD